MQRQGDDDDLHVLVVEDVLVIGTDLDVIRLRAVDAVETLPRPAGLAVEDAAAVERPDVSGSDEFEELGVMLADEHAPLVAGADEPRFNRPAFELLVAEV